LIGITGLPSMKSSLKAAEPGETFVAECGLSVTQEGAQPQGLANGE
jgi:hypothetical protein